MRLGIDFGTTRTVVGGALARANLPSSAVAAVGLTNQRETVVVWDRRTGEPVHHAIVWQDTRTQKMVDEIGGDAGPEIYQVLRHSAGKGLGDDREGRITDALSSLQACGVGELGFAQPRYGRRSRAESP